MINCKIMNRKGFRMRRLIWAALAVLMLAAAGKSQSAPAAAAKTAKPGAPAATTPAQPAPAAQIVPTSPDQDLFKLAKGLFQDGLYENAAGQFRRYLQEFPQGANREEAGFLLGRSLYLIQDYATALAVLNSELPQAKAFRDQILFYTGETAYLLHQDERSVSAFRQLLESYPKFSDADRAKRRLAQIAYRQGNRNLALGAYARALGFYQQAGSPPPDLEPLIWYKTGECLFHLGRLDEADTALKKAEAAIVSSDPDTAGLVMFRRAQLLVEAGRPEEAIPAFQEFLKANPRHPLAAAAHQAIARAYGERDDFKAAAAYLREQGPIQAVEQASQAFESARDHFLLGEYADAEKILKGLTQGQADPELRALSFRLLARVYVEEDKAAEAARLLEGWSQADPGRVDDARRLEIAEFLFQSNQLAPAETLLQAISPGAPASLADRADFLLAETRLRRGEPAAAEKDYKNYLARHPAGPSVPEAWLRLGEIKAQQGDDAGAIEVLRKATPAGADPEILIRGYGLLAESYRKQGLVDSALEASEAQKKLLPQLASAEEQALKRQAELYFRKGDYEKGLAIYAELSGQGQTSRHLDYRWHQGFGLYRLGRLEEANSVWRELAAGPEESSANLARFWLARLQAEAHDFAGANATLQAIVTDDPDFAAGVRWQMGRNLEALDDYAGARQTYQELKQTYPDALVDTRGRLLAVALQNEDYQGYVERVESALGSAPVSFSEAELLARVRAAALAKDEAELNRWARALLLVAVEEASVEEAAFRQAALKIYQDQREEGLKDLEKILDEDPATPFADEINLYLGEELWRQSRCDLALARLKGLDLSQGGPERTARILFMTGDCEGKLGHTQEMVQTFSRLVINYPGSTSFVAERYEVGMALKQAKEYDLAITAFEQALEQEEDRAVLAEAQYWIGECYQAQGDDHRAITEFMKVSYLYPEQAIWSTSAKYQAATILERLGQYQEAVRLYEMVVKEFQGSDMEAFAKQKLEAARQKLGGRPQK